jgi:hypothetical protein
METSFFSQSTTTRRAPWATGKSRPSRTRRSSAAGTTGPTATSRWSAVVTLGWSTAIWSRSTPRSARRLRRRRSRRSPAARCWRSSARGSSSRTSGRERDLNALDGPAPSVALAEELFDDLIEQLGRRPTGFHVDEGDDRGPPPTSAPAPIVSTGGLAKHESAAIVSTPTRQRGIRHADRHPHQV